MNSPNAVIEEPTVVKLLDETDQSPSIRQELLQELEELCEGRRLLSYFSSFVYPVMMVDQDADILEGVLQKLDLNRGLTLIINSPGGMGLAAERIVRVCRTYSKGDFEAIVPKMAKSAATAVCLGANKIWMSDTSELGPIDPQATLQVSPDSPEERMSLSIWNIIESYKELLKEAVATPGNIEPYLQQLQRYDARQIKQWRLELELAEDVVIKLLKSGMMKELSEEDIRERVKILLNPIELKVHGRPIYWEKAKEMGLNIEHVENDSRIWQLVWELYVRSDWYVSNRAGKIVESSKHAFQTPIPRFPEVQS